MKLPHDALLEQILSIPTAPFREGRIISKIKEVLGHAQVPHFSDPVGNLVLGVRSQAEYLRLIKKVSTEPIRIFIAHMDHPGFHGLEWKSKQELAIRWHGGSPTQHLEGAKVWLANRDGWIGEGQMKNALLHSSGRAIESATIVLSNSQTLPPSNLPEEIYGGFGFRAPIWREDDLIYTKAADDLVGTFAIVSLAIELWKKRKRTSEVPFLGILTRAEEVGFIGAIGHLQLGWLKKAKRPLLCVSLETSRALPGAEIGKGPVVRLGDRFTVFDAGALRVFSDLAQSKLPNQHQRKVMDGGTCEATAATAFGLTSIGISVPLGNYHNQSFEGGPDAAPSLGPAPEFVHTQDIHGLIELCHALMQPKLPWNKPWDKKVKELKKGLSNYRALLRSTP
jgi:endoglucanase